MSDKVPKSLRPEKTPVLDGLISEGFENYGFMDGAVLYRIYTKGRSPTQVEPPVMEEREGELVMYEPARDRIRSREHFNS